MKSKYLVTIILAILAAGAGYIYIARQPAVDLGPITVHHESKQATSTPSSELKDWKTYKADQYGFELKYPSDWCSKESKESTSGDTKDTGYTIAIGFLPCKTLQDFSKQYLDEFGTPNL